MTEPSPDQVLEALRKDDPDSLGRLLGAATSQGLQSIVQKVWIYRLELEVQNAELRRLHAELESSRDRYLDLYDSAPVGYFTLDGAGLILDVNLTGARLLGSSKADIIHQPFGRLAIQGDRDLVHVFHRAVLQDERGSSVVVRLQRLDGAAFHARIVGSRSIDQPGQCRIAVSDVEEAFRLDFNRAQADRLSSLGILASGVAHEVNNPLTSLMFNLDSVIADLGTLKEEGTSESVPSVIEHSIDLLCEAVKAAGQIRDLVRTFSRFSRLDPSELRPIDMGHVLDQALRMCWNEIRFRAQIVRDFAPVGPVIGAESRLTQVFLNLLVNAAHAIAPGNVAQNKVEVRLWGEGDDVFVEVRDTGQGIPADQQSKIFEPFFTTKMAGNGVGLGLSISKSIVTNFGGDIRFTSEVGKGTSFVVRLKRAPKTDAPIVESKAGQAALQPSTQSPRGRVLIVDDEVGIRKGLERLVESHHDVVSIGSADEARVLLQSDRDFDVVLCDLMMPGMVGTQLHAWMETVDKPLADRFLFMTGGAFLPEVSQYLVQARRPVLEKPFDVPLLLRCLDGVVMASRKFRVR